MSNARLDMTNTLKLLDEAREMIVDLDGGRVDVDRSNNKEFMRAKAEMGRGLLFAAHLTDLARADVINQYHRFKGEQTPSITPTDL